MRGRLREEVLQPVDAAKTHHRVMLTFGLGEHEHVTTLGVRCVVCMSSVCCVLLNDFKGSWPS